MMRVTLDFMFILVLTSVCKSDVVIKHRQTYKGMKTYYKLTGMTYDFNSAIDWCQSLGGQLPIVLTQDELDFLADEVIVRNDGAMTDSKTTWMGLKKEKGHCFNWLDGTRVNMSFSYYSRCESCTASCCAMYVWNDVDHKKMSFTDCSRKAKVVCVIDEEKVRKEIEYLKKSSLTSMILHWTTLTIIGCLILTIGFIGYQTRRRSMPIPENSVTYVADENRLNFNHPDLKNVNRKVNNLHQPEKDNCGAP